VTAGSTLRPGAHLLAGVTTVASAVLRHDPAELRGRARELLSRPPYRAEDPGALQQLVAWIRDRLAAVLDAVFAALGEGTGVAWGVVVVGVVLLLAVAWYASRGFAVDRRDPTAVAVEPGRSSTDWVAEAERHEAGAVGSDDVQRVGRGLVPPNTPRMSKPRMGLVAYWKGYDRKTYLKAAQLADDLGYESFWVPEAWGYDAFPLITEMALRTKRIKLCTGIVNVFSRSPGLRPAWHLENTIPLLQLRQQGIPVPRWVFTWR
jgi:hypothetical protein